MMRILIACFAFALAAPAYAMPRQEEGQTLAEFLEKAEFCVQTASEMGDNEEQNRQLQENWEVASCGSLEMETESFREAFADTDELEEINAAVDPLGF